VRETIEKLSDSVAKQRKNNEHPNSKRNYRRIA
jgi:hypothetical protein